MDDDNRDPVRFPADRRLHRFALEIDRKGHAELVPFFADVSRVVEAIDENASAGADGATVDDVRRDAVDDLRTDLADDLEPLLDVLESLEYVMRDESGKLTIRRSYSGGTGSTTL